MWHGGLLQQVLQKRGAQALAVMAFNGSSMLALPKIPEVSLTCLLGYIAFQAIPRTLKSLGLRAHLSLTTLIAHLYFAMHLHQTRGSKPRFGLELIRVNDSPENGILSSVLKARNVTFGYIPRQFRITTNTIGCNTCVTKGKRTLM